MSTNSAHISEQNIDSDPKQVDEVSRLLKSAGDALRLQILAVLSKNAFGVSELSQIFDVKQNGMSHHLKTLSSNHLLTTRREGNTIFYRRSDEPTSPILSDVRASIFKAADQIELSQEIQQNLVTLFEQRARSSKQFFIDNATAFKEQQDLIAEFSVYGPEVEKLLEQSTLPSYDHALEIGPGSGEFLPLLAKRFETVTAIELSASMLEQSKKRCLQNKLSNVQFILNDTRICREMDKTLDCVVINMVLHHTPAPSQIFEDVSLSIKAKGALIICELSQHDQDWVKDACGDQWLGFSSHELKAWAEASEFSCGLDRYFALRNGFQIQIHQFIKR